MNRERLRRTADTSCWEVIPIKYLLAALLFWVTALPTHATAPLPPLIALSATASFATTDPAGTTTEVELTVHDAAPFTQVTIFVRRTRQGCVGSACQPVLAIDAVIVHLVPPRDAFIDRQGREGFVHGTFRLHDAVRHADLVVRVDADWSARQPPVCTALAVGGTCVRVATVLADVASGAERFVANLSIPDGQISWQEPA